jgi:hypothetical protein
MKKQITFVFLLTLSILSCFSQDSENEKPKSTFIITVDGKEYTVSEGEELNVNNSIVTVKLSPLRTFKTDFLSFNYPSNFSYSFESDAFYKNWSLDGSDYVVMLFEIGVKTSMDVFIDEMIGQFGKQNCTTELSSKNLGGKDLKGKRINVNLVGQRLIIDFLEIPNSSGKSRFLALQDVLDEDGSPTKESQKTLEVIDQSIKFN